MKDINPDFDALLEEYQVNLSSSINNDSKDNSFDLSMLNNDNYIQYIWFVVDSQWSDDNEYDNMKYLIDGLQNTDDAADCYSNVWQGIEIYLTNEVLSEYYPFVQKWIDFMMNKVNLVSIHHCDLKEFRKQCLYVVLYEKFDVNGSNINHITDKRAFMNNILLILFEHGDYHFQRHLLMYHFELILQFVADKWERIRSLYHIQNTHCQAAHIDLEQKTELDEKNNDADDSACNLPIFQVRLILFLSSLVL